jgi:preflagellin peptidase FlaK
MLITCSAIDFWKREIHDYYWIGFGIVGVILIFIDPDIFSRLFQIGISLIIAPFVIFIWRIGLFGGADAFALIPLAIIAPMTTISGNPTPPFTVLGNGIILFIIPLSLNVIRNTIAFIRKERIFEGFDESKIKKIAAIMIGYKTKNPNFCFPMEKIENGRRKIDFKIHNAEGEEYCNKPNTWITPGIPYLLLITGGFIIQLLFGDIFLNFFIQ